MLEEEKQKQKHLISLLFPNPYEIEIGDHTLVILNFE